MSVLRVGRIWWVLGDFWGISTWRTSNHKDQIGFFLLLSLLVLWICYCYNKMISSLFFRFLFIVHTPMDLEPLSNKSFLISILFISIRIDVEPHSHWLTFDLILNEYFTISVAGMYIEHYGIIVNVNECIV